MEGGISENPGTGHGECSGLAGNTCDTAQRELVGLMRTLPFDGRCACAFRHLEAAGSSILALEQLWAGCWHKGLRPHSL